MEITINVPKQVGQQLQDYAASHNISIDKLTTEFWQTVIQGDIDEVIFQELERRRKACESGEEKILSEGEFNEKLHRSIGKVNTRAV